MKCTTPFCVFLSDCSRARILRGLTFTSGRRPRLNTASAMRPAVTLNAAGSGVITTESLSSAAGSPYTLTLTNNMVAAADVVLATVQNGTNTGGDPHIMAVGSGEGV